MKKHKDIITYLLINIILLAIALILVVIISFSYKNIRTNILSNINQYSDILSNKETEDELYNIENLEIELVEPSIIDKNNALIENSVQTNNIKYYYDQLGNNAKLIYDEIEKNADNIKTGTYIITLPNSISKILEEDNGTEQLNKDFQAAWDAIIMDRMDFFYIDISKIVLKIAKTTYLNKSEYTLTIEPSNSGSYLEEGFYNKEDVDKAIEQTENIKNQIISGLNGNNYNKIKMVHDYLIDNMEYGTDISANNSYNIYGALIGKSAVCEGYAEAFKYILDDIGVPCIIVSGTAQNSEGITENHEWNYVQLDGKWYGIDVTWDDPIIIGGYLTESEKYRYFLKSSSTINKNHFPNGVVSSSGIEFIYPELTDKDY